MCNWRRQVKFMPLDWGMVMRYQDYNSICRKRSKLPDRGNLSKWDYTSQRLWIFWNLMNIKKSSYVRFSAGTTICYPWFWFLYVSLSFKILWTVCLITCPKKECCVCFLVLFYLYNDWFFTLFPCSHISMVALQTAVGKCQAWKVLFLWLGPSIMHLFQV